MPAQLVSLNEGPNILLDKPILLLGRHPECDVQIESRKISRRHCCIAQVSDYLVVRDLGSTNGIRINGARVLEDRLAPGDELTIGTFRYRVVWDSMMKSGPIPSALPVAKPVQNIPVNEADLEECDKPVPLPEPNLRDRPPPAPLASTSRATSPREDSLVLPDDLDLLPPSDILRRNPS